MMIRRNAAIKRDRGLNVICKNRDYLSIRRWSQSILHFLQFILQSFTSNQDTLPTKFVEIKRLFIMRFQHVYALLLMFVLCTSCNGQVKTDIPKEKIKYETKVKSAKHTVFSGRPNFSGEWKSKESISMGGNIVCTYGEGDRMLSKTMKIAEQADFLTIEVPNLSHGTTPATSREKLAFDGRASEI